MGGGDLNFKKSWHPLRLHNQEKVWKEEKKAEEEAKRLAQLQKEIEEQRQLEEMQQLQEKAGLKKRSNQLDWMYTSGGAHASGGIDEDKEAYLLGSRKVDKLLAASEQEAAFSLSSGSALDLSNANTLRDTQSKVREDPLLMIKKMEKASLDRYLNNPLKINQFKESKSKKEKKSKKDKKSKKEESESADDTYSRRYRDSLPARDFKNRESDDRNSFQSSLSPQKMRKLDERSRYSHDRSESSRRSTHYRSYHRSSISPKRRSPTQEFYKEYSSNFKKASHLTRDSESNALKDEERKRMIEAMLNNAAELEVERKERILICSKREELEELEQTKIRSQVHHGGHVTKFQREARHSAYSSGAADLASRIRTQRTKLRLDD